ncbi:glycosyltransferase family 31 protein [Purpureocillium lavendulum]|uniref:Glycosyltransferase family 31 protein n=1 Tax=Purpureocillium lavendulum TaxID=1247861 RepID=A0AB34G0V0_9HYPO|nr:glycosyltransferase family 31 protein [Purpureocillium lavendulum]
MCPMDAPDADLDVKLQKMAGDLIADLDAAIAALPRKPDGRGGMRLRAYVRTREALNATTSILDMFQELPQLLDPHLPKWIPFLADAYLEHVEAARTRGLPRRRLRHGGGGGREQFLVPLDFALCRVLYAFCKVRGEKVIVRFLSAETRYLEILLSAIEDAEAHEQQQQQQQQAAGGREDEAPGQGDSGGDDDARAWRWEQRYVVLLWLSHQLLAPFDLSTISSIDVEDAPPPLQMAGLTLPKDLPGITMRVIPLAIKYLATPGKEKDAAKALLVRIAMRRDMQQLGVLDSLIRWALASLRPPPKNASLYSMHFYLGVLAFLAGVLRASAETSDLDAWLPAIFETVYGITTGDSELSKMLLPLAVVRKTILKVIRSVTVSLLRKTPRDMASTELTETTIGYLLESVSDGDTPVRLSASKALSIITLKLDPDMAAQVVEAVLESLNRNVLWTRPAGGSTVKPVRDLSAVDSLEWHGLMLTLSHLLYRRSPPAAHLSDIIHALLLGLSFEQRSTSGGSVGANVRDAACFGIWAIARRYTSRELLAVPTQSVFAAKAHPAESSILQVLATELVVTASLDPAGNIRRGASAALQELIGRHPDTVEQGIAVVQTVDYHAVARRSRAVEEVATNVTRLSPKYGEALVDGILGWRGIGDMDAPSRRVAGAAFGVLKAELAQSTLEAGLSRFESSVQLVTQRIGSLAKRQVEERHGLLLCLASLIDQIPAALCLVTKQAPETSSPSSTLFHNVLSSVSQILEDCGAVDYRKPELVAEAASQVVVSSLPVLQAVLLPDAREPALEKGRETLSPARTGGYLGLVVLLDESGRANGHADADTDALTSKLRAVMPAWLSRNEPEAVGSASAAALVLLIFSNQEERGRTLCDWAAVVRSKPTSRTAATGIGYFHALALAQPLAALGEKATSDVACEALLERWRADPDVDTRVAVLQSLIRSHVLQTKPLTFLGLLRDGLDDYTTNARGDVGSHVRVQALRAVQVLWRDVGDERVGREAWVGNSIKTLFHSTLRLAAEKLDRVRPEAKEAVALTLKAEHAKRFQSLSFSSKAYFETLLSLIALEDCMHPWLAQPARADSSAWMAELVAGYVTSANTGNDDLVVASRAALTDFCEAGTATSSDRLDLVCAALLRNLRARQGDDRVVVPTLEIVAFLFHCGLFQRCRDVDLRALCLQTQKASYKSGNVRKIMACVKVYGGVASIRRRSGSGSGSGSGIGGGGGSGSSGADDAELNVAAAVQEARKRLGALLFHPWPRVRSVVVDELWGLTGDIVAAEDGDEGAAGSSPLTGVDWAKADKATVRAVVQDLGLA